MVRSERCERWKSLVRVTTFGLMADQMLLILEKLEQGKPLDEADKALLSRAQYRLLPLMAVAQLSEAEFLPVDPIELEHQVNYCLFVDWVRNVTETPPDHSELLLRISSGLMMLEAGRDLPEEDEVFLKKIFTAISDCATATHNALLVQYAH